MTTTRPPRRQADPQLMDAVNRLGPQIYKLRGITKFGVLVSADPQTLVVHIAYIQEISETARRAREILEPTGLPFAIYDASNIDAKRRID